MRRAHVDPLPPGRLDVKNSIEPSCDQRGFELSVPGDVHRTGSPPAVGTTQTSECRLFSDSFTVVTVIATSRPSGDIAGEPTVVPRYLSVGVNARFAVCWADAPAAHKSSSNTTLIDRMGSSFTVLMWGRRL
jgi:hypothetical protein